MKTVNQYMRRTSIVLKTYSVNNLAHLTIGITFPLSAHQNVNNTPMSRKNCLKATSNIKFLEKI